MTMKNSLLSAMFRCVTMAALLVVLLAAASCGGDGAAPAPATSPRLPPPSSIEAWLQVSPLRAGMRALWIDGANVLHFTSDPTGAHLDSVECAGEDLARKAGRYAAFWQQVEDAAGAATTAARAGAWDDAAHRYGRIWKACCDCHVDTWPLALRSYTPEILQTWVEGKQVTAAVRWGDAYERRQEQRPATPLHERMRRLNALTQRMAVQIDSRDGVAVAEAATLINALAEEGGEIWWEIHDRGKAIQAAAEAGRVRVIRSLYRALREECVRCHAMSLIGDRPLLDPPLWR